MTDEQVEGESGPSPRITAWTVGLLCVSVVASGVIVSGLFHEPQYDLTTAPTTTRNVTTTAPEPTSTYRTPEVEFPARIPGCATVEPPSGESRWGSVMGSPNYDNPDFPWFSARKAVAMSDALRSALPDGVVLDWGPIDRSLVFEPILGTAGDEFSGFTHAAAGLRRGELAGSLSLAVRQGPVPVPPCVAGRLDERRVLADGTTVDLQDTWSETDGVRTLSRDAIAYRPDGSTVSAYSTDASELGGKPSGTVPISREELLALVLTPGVQVAAPIPPGTLSSTGACSVGVDDSEPISESVAKRLDAVLAEIRLDGYTFDRPLAGLRPGEYGPGGLCRSVELSAGGLTSRLTLSIGAGIALPATLPADPGSSGRTLPDGSVVQATESQGMAMDEPDQAVRVYRRVAVTRPSGTKIVLDSAASAPAEPLTAAQLETIALTPGLEVNS
ncbi:hypothetical protein ACFVMC_26805 [Nocardia sp. NPDC127579]|uniref:hypothetical protein n=1 Tax=Nocardia sp. NPDC127579 TaxID=3345402 RepID=UPI00362A8EFF